MDRKRPTRLKWVACQLVLAGCICLRWVHVNYAVRFQMMTGYSPDTFSLAIRYTMRFYFLFL